MSQNICHTVAAISERQSKRFYNRFDLMNEIITVYALSVRFGFTTKTIGERGSPLQSGIKFVVYEKLSTRPQLPDRAISPSARTISPDKVRFHSPTANFTAEGNAATRRMSFKICTKLRSGKIGIALCKLSTRTGNGGSP